ncbi:MAG: HD domain-containing phosphohydrolase [Nitrospinales bacterium]
MKEQKFRTAKIMIVDDEPGNVQVLARILKWAKYDKVLTTTDPTKVERLYQEFKPDILLLDLKMPEMDGFDVMAHLKTIEPDDFLPILVLTAQQDRKVRLKALKAGAKDFLNKPFDTAEVLLRINNLVETHQLHKQIRNQNKTLEEKVLDRTKELSESRLEIINRLARAAEYRDNETGMHIVRMSRLCARLGELAGLSPKECELILHASPMHDVGKIGIPDNILMKPGKLSPAEWEIMKMHPIIGSEMLSGSSSELLQMAETIALTHQERWDGSGYPKGLKGEEIPLVGRIVALCDVFDALTNARPYKGAFPVFEAMIEIESKSGILFDPHLVNIFKTDLPEMLRIISQHADSEDDQAGKSKLKEIFKIQNELLAEKHHFH